MPFFPQSNRPARPDLAIKRHAPTTGGGPAPLRSESVGSFERHAINAPCRIEMQSTTYAEIYADMPTLYLDTPASAKSSLVRAPTKAFRPGMLEP
jgi:hypothetical protein